MKKSNYITREGWQALDREFKYLWKEERPRVTQAVSEAAALGDRSENAEYIYGKKRLREIDRRLRYLGKRLDALTIVEPHPQQYGRVFFGAFVELENEAGELSRFHIVGPDEFDLSLGKLSIDSPLARALLKKQADDEVSVETPSGVQHYFINAISYQPFNEG